MFHVSCFVFAKGGIRTLDSNLATCIIDHEIHIPPCADRARRRGEWPPSMRCCRGAGAAAGSIKAEDYFQGLGFLQDLVLEPALRKFCDQSAASMNLQKLRHRELTLR